MLDEKLTNLVKSIAREVGFDRYGIARAEPIGRAEYVRAWLDSGRAGSMAYLHRHFEKRVDPGKLLPGARSVVVAALSYHQPVPGPGLANPDLLGRVAMYAWGEDYHTVVKDKLFRIVDRLRTEVSEPFEAKVCVDTAPLIEREFAAAAGIGWIGKNTLVLDRQLGSYFFLGEIVTTLDLVEDEPVADRCGSCSACRDACPTNALDLPYQMDAARCISYLTIEHRGELSDELARQTGNWIFGCDICEQVCPHNRRAARTREPAFAGRAVASGLPLDEILGWTVDDYRERLRGSTMKRATLEMLKRNARIAKVNAGCDEGTS
ncbi:MAG: tRNA epoxyqueuosine(34) reductase QueG [Phycisphaerales bacterium]|nr:MAG: tRNA epoxyqueuosine(34) reductase QueG [Phycisphaerales bacterium]